MSLLALRVELPSYSHSFQIAVPVASTVLDVKQAIFESCAGSPRVEGQRIVWRGRFLGDAEKVADIWKSEDDAPVVHLAVHPSAWTTAPPEVSSPSPTPTQPRPSSSVPVTQGAQATRTSPVSNTRHTVAEPVTYMNWGPIHPPPPSVRPLAFIAFRHQNALLALTHQPLLSPTSPDDLEITRQLAVNTIGRRGWSWPEILNEEFPAAQDESAGVKYEKITIDGHEYLSLVDGSSPPTPLQTHALKVISFTFPLLSIPSPIATSYGTPVPSQTFPLRLPRGFEAIIDQDIARGRQRHLEQRGQFEIPALPLRDLVIPLFLLVVRTVFLLYFFSPIEKPVFGILVGAWMFYEAWNAIRAAIVEAAHVDGANAAAPREGGAEGPAHNGNANADNANNGNGNENGNARAPAAPPGPRAGTPSGARQRSQGDAVIESVASLNLRAENDALEGRSSQRAAPTAGHRLKTFVQLLVLTVHPAVWDRRRVAMRQREGRVRAEANAREPPREEEAATENADGEGGVSRAAERERVERARSEMVAVHERRPGWVKEYIERVRRVEWVDDT